MSIPANFSSTLGFYKGNVMINQLLALSLLRTAAAQLNSWNESKGAYSLSVSDASQQQAAAGLEIPVTLLLLQNNWHKALEWANQTLPTNYTRNSLENLYINNSNIIVNEFGYKPYNCYLCNPTFPEFQPLYDFYIQEISLKFNPEIMERRTILIGHIPELSPSKSYIPATPFERAKDALYFRALAEVFEPLVSTLK